MHSLKYVRYIDNLGKLSPWCASIQNEHFTQVFDGSRFSKNYHIVDEVIANEVTYELLKVQNHELIPYIPTLWLFLHYIKENHYGEVFVCKCWATYEDYFNRNDNYDVQLIEQYNFYKKCFTSIQGQEEYKIAIPTRNPQVILDYLANNSFLAHVDELESDLSI